MTTTRSTERQTIRAGNGARVRLPASSTPRSIALLMVALVVLSLAWGAVGVWTTYLHASAASGVLNTSEPGSFQARQMYQSLSDADVTATTAFLSGPRESLPMRQHYQADIAQAGADLSSLKNAASASGNSQVSASLAAIATGLPVYTADVAQAQTDYALGYQLTGGSFMQVASEQMHLTLLPAARSIYASANARLAAQSAQATGLPWILVALVLSAGLGYTLYRAQRWLSRRMRRTINYGLLLASVVMMVTAVWLLIAYAVARGDLQQAERHGSAPAQSLAQASITSPAGQGRSGPEPHFPERQYVVPGRLHHGAEAGRARSWHTSRVRSGRLDWPGSSAGGGCRARRHRLVHDQRQGIPPGRRGGLCSRDGPGHRIWQ